MPDTEAGRALLGELGESPLPGARYAHGVVKQRLAAIEREAAARALAEVRERVEALPSMNPSDPEHGWDEPVVPRAAVLAAIKEASRG